MNKILKLLILSDIFIFSGFGFISPIIAIFFNDKVVGGSILTAGIASAIYLIVHSLLQITFSYVFNPKDRLWMLLTGTGLMAVVPIGYIFSTHIYHIYIVQFVYGLSAALAYPSWQSLFTSYLERGQRGFQWSIYNSSVGIGSAITAGVGGLIAEAYGFNTVFILAGVFSVVGLLTLFFLEKKELKKI